MEAGQPGVDELAAFLVKALVPPPVRIHLHGAEHAPVGFVGRNELLQRVLLQPGVLVEQIGKRVALVQRHAQADVVGCAEAQVLPRLDDAHLREIGANKRQRAVRGAVVDHHHVGGMRGILHAPQALADPLQRIVGHDDDEDVSHGSTS